MLSDKEKRARYDMYGPEAPTASSSRRRSEAYGYDYTRGFEGPFLPFPFSSPAHALGDLEGSLRRRRSLICSSAGASRAVRSTGAGTTATTGTRTSSTRTRGRRAAWASPSSSSPSSSSYSFPSPHSSSRETPPTPSTGTSPSPSSSSPPFSSQEGRRRLCSKYTVERKTAELGVAYFVKPDFLKHYRGSIQQVERSVEDDYISQLRMGCYRERNQSPPSLPLPSLPLRVWRMMGTGAGCRGGTDLAGADVRGSTVVGEGAEPRHALLRPPQPRLRMINPHSPVTLQSHSSLNPSTTLLHSGWRGGFRDRNVCKTHLEWGSFC